MEKLVAPLMTSPKGAGVAPSPGDALQAGVHTSIRSSSQHKKAVSAVLHLKKESIGKRTKPTAFSGGAKAFKPPHL